ncbi:hypothetical protein [Methanolobus chelungpuianus]|uniref:Uncharacterized protein n=1 Tax=Methanolobus chelungpuianus TaxID=502115 RepID=A0AAE3KWX2_9EURY|nr:hypothetical protein [Methanolobus chelungpuianus]MCQ6962452.1 hypothetical protein [Methanolobus chelungpuianus]
MPKASKRKQARAPSAPSGEAVTVKEAGQADVTVAASKPAYKVKTPEERKQAHIEGIIKTAVASVIGVIAGILSYSQFGVGDEVRWYAVVVIVVALAYYALRLIFPLIRIDTKEFGFKDWFYVEFLVVDFCLVTWTLLLN